MSNCVPFEVPGLLTSSSSTTPSLTSPSSSSQDSVFDVNRCTENPVHERSGSASEELRENPLHPQKPKTNMKMGNQKKHKGIWPHELPMEPRTKVEPGSGKHSVHTHFPKACEQRNGAVVPKAKHFQVNRGTIIDKAWWYKIWQCSGCNHTHVKQTLPRRPRKTR